MALSKNTDRYTVDESFDCTPVLVQGIFSSANYGYTKRQSRLAREIVEKDPAIAQAWSVRVAAIASCPWEVVGGSSEQNTFIEKSLRNIQPAFDTGLVSFNKLLQFLQSAVMDGFSANTIEWGTVMQVSTGSNFSLNPFLVSKIPICLTLLVMARWMETSAKRESTSQPRVGFITQRQIQENQSL